MSEDLLDEVLDFSKNHVKALVTRPDILRHILGCDICNSLMIDPYTLQCGHSFCGKCLESWTKERVSNATCPTCRTQLNTEPVMSLALRQLGLAVIDSWNKDPQHTEKVNEEHIGQREKPQFFPEGALDAPRYDSEDDVYRCPNCSHEIEDDGRCSGCDRYFADRDVYGEDNSWPTDTDYEDDENNPRYSRARGARNLASGRAFTYAEVIEDDDEEEEENDSDAGFDLDSFIAEDEEDIVDEDTDSSNSSSPENGSDDEMKEDDGSEGPDADDTSDDSLLEETRRVQNNDDDDDDIEIVEVHGQGRRRQHVVIDDDDSD